MRNVYPTLAIAVITLWIGTVGGGVMGYSLGQVADSNPSSSASQTAGTPVPIESAFQPGPGLPCNVYDPVAQTNRAGIYKWETAGAADYYVSCDVTP